MKMMLLATRRLACHSRGLLRDKSHASVRTFASSSNPKPPPAPVSVLGMLGGSIFLVSSIIVLKQLGFDRKFVSEESAALAAERMEAKAPGEKKDVSKASGVQLGLAIVAGIVTGLVGGRLLAPKLWSGKQAAHPATKAVLSYLEQRGFKAGPVSNVIGRFKENGAVFSFESSSEGNSIKVNAQAIRNTVTDQWECTDVKVTQENGLKVNLEKTR